MLENQIAPSPDLAIQAQNLSKTFGFIKALQGLSFELRAGQFLTIFGPNGAGKTTLIKILSTLAKPTSGSARVAGYDILKGDPRLRNEVGVISHVSFLYGDLTPFENMLFYAKMHRLENQTERAVQVVEEAGLKARMHDPVRTFSRGMLQRLSIARAVLHNPSVLFLDEPYTGLDPHASNVFKEQLHSLHTQKRTILMTTHDIARGLEMCDQAAILVKGRIALMEPAENIDKNNFEKLYFETIANEKPY
ncbi:MAG: ABC transporter ATP-binding protein [Nitrospinales bacterium]